MTDAQHLIAQLNAPLPNDRLNALRELKNLRDGGHLDVPARGLDVNNHIHTCYSFSPYSPTKAVWMADQAGLSTAGIMDHAKFGDFLQNALALATGNKSEFAVGYSTLYGDSNGALAPIGDIYKTRAFQLARWRNQLAVERGDTPPIPTSTITKPPSAELRPDQRDDQSLPPYDELDVVLERYVDDHYVPRAVMVDLEPRVINGILSGEHSKLFSKVFTCIFLFFSF